MSVEVKWHNEEKTVMYFKYKGKWTWDVALSKVALANMLMDEQGKGKPCVSIVDMRQSNYMPPESGKYIRAMILMSVSHNNSGITVFINADIVVAGIIDLLRSMYPDIRDFSNFLYAKDLTEAGRLAEEQVKRLHSNLNRSE
jgi:hypothetical protein